MIELKQFRTTLGRWNSVIRRVSQFNDQDRAAYKELVGLANTATQLGLAELDPSKVVEITIKHGSEQNFLADPPIIENDKDNGTVFKGELVNLLAEIKDAMTEPGHRVYDAFNRLYKKEIALETLENNNESEWLEADYANLKKQVKYDLLSYFCAELKYPMSPMTENAFEETFEFELEYSKFRARIQRDSKDKLLRDIINTPADINCLIRNAKIVNWKYAKDGMRIIARLFNVIKKMCNENGGDNFWIYYGARGGEGKSAYCNGELEFMLSNGMKAYLGDNKCFGEQFNVPEPLKSTFLYIREDRSWSPAQIDYKKQLTDQERVSVEQKGVDAQRTQPKCMITSQTNYRSWEISRRFAVVEFGRQPENDRELSPAEATRLYKEVTEKLLLNVFDRKDQSYVRNCCLKICRGMETANNAEDKNWAYNTIAYNLRDKIYPQNSETPPPEGKTYLRVSSFIAHCVKQYINDSNKLKIVSNENRRQELEDALREIIDQKMFGDTLKIGSMEEYEAINNDGTQVASLAHGRDYIIVPNIKECYNGIDQFFKRLLKKVDQKEEEELFDKYAKYLLKIVNSGDVMKIDRETLAAILNCTAPLPEDGSAILPPSQTQDGNHVVDLDDYSISTIEGWTDKQLVELCTKALGHEPEPPYEQYFTGNTKRLMIVLNKLQVANGYKTSEEQNESQGTI